jgi:hypothetical protein
MASNPQSNRSLFKHTRIKKYPRLAYDVIHLAAKEAVESVNPCSYSVRVCRFDATTHERAASLEYYLAVQKYPRNCV